MIYSNEQISFPFLVGLLPNGEYMYIQPDDDLDYDDYS